MPKISLFYGILIQMFWKDHPPPHFHVRYAGFKAQIDIGTLEVINGDLPRLPSFLCWNGRRSIVPS